MNIKITLSNNSRHKNKYSVFVNNGNSITECRFSHSSKARNYVKNYFEESEVEVIDNIVEPVKTKLGLTLEEYNKRLQYGNSTCKNI